MNKKLIAIFFLLVLCGCLPQKRSLPTFESESTKQEIAEHCKNIRSIGSIQKEFLNIDQQLEIIDYSLDNFKGPKTINRMKEAVAQISDSSIKIQLLLDPKYTAVEFFNTFVWSWRYSELGFHSAQELKGTNIQILIEEWFTNNGKLDPNYLNLYSYVQNDRLYIRYDKRSSILEICELQKLETIALRLRDNQNKLDKRYLLRLRGI